MLKNIYRFKFTFWVLYRKHKEIELRLVRKRYLIGKKSTFFHMVHISQQPHIHLRGNKETHLHLQLVY